jgi:hypothetical protein
MFPITPAAYEEFREYIARQPDSAFVPKEGDDTPTNRSRREARSGGPASDPRADRARNQAIFANRKVAQIKEARQRGRLMKALLI